MQVDMGPTLLRIFGILQCFIYNVILKIHSRLKRNSKRSANVTNDRYFVTNCNDEALLVGST